MWERMGDPGESKNSMKNKWASLGKLPGRHRSAWSSPGLGLNMLAGPPGPRAFGQDPPETLAPLRCSQPLSHLPCLLSALIQTAYSWSLASLGLPLTPQTCCLKLILDGDLS